MVRRWRSYILPTIEYVFLDPLYGASRDDGVAERTTVPVGSLGDCPIVHKSVTLSVLLTNFQKTALTFP